MCYFFSTATVLFLKYFTSRCSIYRHVSVNVVVHTDPCCWWCRHVSLLCKIKPRASVLANERTAGPLTKGKGHSVCRSCAGLVSCVHTLPTRTSAHRWRTSADWSTATWETCIPSSMTRRWWERTLPSGCTAADCIPFSFHVTSGASGVPSNAVICFERGNPTKFSIY